MSANLIKKLVNKKQKTEHKDKKPRSYQWRFLLALPAWVVLSYFTVNFLIVGALWALGAVGIQVSDMMSETVFQSVFSTIMYAMTLAVAIGVPFMVLKRPTSLSLLGLQRLPTWTDIGLTPLAYVAYALVGGIVLYLILAIYPAFPIEETQDVGFRALSGQYDYMLAFIMLVVVGPIAEEALFRGYLYGKLRPHVPIWAAMLATSILFALAHQQPSVAVDTFVLGMFLVGLREVTGSIWAGILLHMLKNAVAFYAMFVAPMSLG